MNCNKCGAENDGTSNYCQKCGERLVPELFCAKCGKPLKPDSKFCVECGTQIGSENTQSAGFSYKPNDQVEKDDGNVRGADVLDEYYKNEFQKIKESNETYKGKWNWAEIMNKFINDFLSRLSGKKWLFAILIYIACYLLVMLGGYHDEAEKIRQKSLNHFGGDITENLGFFEVLKSAGINYWHVTYRIFYKVFIPWLLIAAYFMDYKNEPHPGWSRVFISAQILIPTLTVLSLLLIINSDYWSWELLAGIDYFGWVEVVVLLLINIFIWVRAGFSKPAN